MAILHLVNRTAALQDCLKIAVADDAVLLIEDGVYAARAPTETQARVYALGEDVLARGLANRLATGIKLVGYEEFVQLACDHQPIVSWPS